MSLWEFAAAVDGHNRAHNPEEPLEPLTEAEFDDMLARHADWIAAGQAQ